MVPYGHGVTLAWCWITAVQGLPCLQGKKTCFSANHIKKKTQKNKTTTTFDLKINFWVESLYLFGSQMKSIYNLHQQKRRIVAKWR